MILNFRINEISGKRGVSIETGNIDSFFKVVNAEKKNDPVVGDYVFLNFEFDVLYPGEMGNIKFKGNLWYHDIELDKKIAEEEKEIGLNADAVRDVSNAILQNCLFEAIGVARRLNLPSPIKLPQITSAKPIKYEKAKTS